MPRDHRHAYRMYDNHLDEETGTLRNGWERCAMPARPCPNPASGHGLATASLATALVSLIAWPLGFAAIWLAWKATRRGQLLGWPAAAYATGGASLGFVTAAFTTGIALAAIASAIR